MSTPESLPNKAKRKKRSFLEDDDFFVIKKKKKHPKPTKLDAAGPSTDHSAHGLMSPEDYSQTYHSAVESPTELISEPVDNPVSLDPTSRSPKAASIRGLSSRANTSLDASQPESSGKPIDLDEAETEHTPTNEPISLSDSGDDSDTELKNFFGTISKTKDPAEDEDSRLYEVTFSSRFGDPLEYKLIIGAKMTFGKFLNQVKRHTRRKQHIPHYWDLGVLVWVEGRFELKPFFKPSTLRIPKTDSPKIHCLFIPREHLENLERLYFDDTPSVVEEVADKAQETTNASSKPAGPGLEEKSEYFVIGLKGKDNKRIEAEVGPSTQLRSLLRYYILAKKLNVADESKCKLIFDDEQLDLDSFVRDTELEEDFEVQVHVD